ncbi:MAG TPA: hypothetical protein DCM28_20640 [Phycisphaerales bacterium]|nr:hypothetical protein [Phycisphaerales bacterium]|tara:strand:- start:66680 stop:67411 length:732 start_codon:yes stop_codon:yes gene_type:complete
MNKKILKTICASLAVAAAGLTTSANAAVITGLTLGDTSTDTVYVGSDPTLKSVADSFGITIGGNPINTTTDQTQWQAFTVTGGAANVTFEYLGSSASYNNQLGVAYAPLSNPTNFSYLHAFTNNIDAVGTSATVTVAEDSIFGFYVNVNSGSEQFFSINDLNDDNKGSLVTDHFLIFDTDQGLLVGLEDIRYNKDTGKLGDQDYNDVIFNVKVSGVPEPASAALLLIGGAMLLGRNRKKRPQH